MAPVSCFLGPHAGVVSRHVRGKKRAAKTAWILLNFQAYVKYHIKCTRSHIQSRMRQRLEALTEVIQDAGLRGNHDKTRSQGKPLPLPSPPLPSQAFLSC